MFFLILAFVSLAFAQPPRPDIAPQWSSTVNYTHSPFFPDGTKLKLTVTATQAVAVNPRNGTLLLYCDTLGTSWTVNSNGVCSVGCYHQQCCNNEGGEVDHHGMMIVKTTTTKKERALL